MVRYRGGNLPDREKYLNNNSGEGEKKGMGKELAGQAGIETSNYTDMILNEEFLNGGISKSSSTEEKFNFLKDEIKKFKNRNIRIIFKDSKIKIGININELLNQDFGENIINDIRKIVKLLALCGLYSENLNNIIYNYFNNREILEKIRDRNNNNSGIIGINDINEENHDYTINNSDKTIILNKNNIPTKYLLLGKVIGYIDYKASIKNILKIFNNNIIEEVLSFLHEINKIESNGNDSKAKIEAKESFLNNLFNIILKDTDKYGSFIDEKLEIINEIINEKNKKIKINKISLFLEEILGLKISSDFGIKIKVISKIDKVNGRNQNQERVHSIIKDHGYSNGSIYNQNNPLYYVTEGEEILVIHPKTLGKKGVDENGKILDSYDGKDLFSIDSIAGENIGIRKNNDGTYSYYSKINGKIDYDLDNNGNIKRLVATKETKVKRINPKETGVCEFNEEKIHIGEVENIGLEISDNVKTSIKGPVENSIIVINLKEGESSELENCTSIFSEVKNSVLIVNGKGVVQIEGLENSVVFAPSCQVVVNKESRSTIIHNECHIGNSSATKAIVGLDIDSIVSINNALFVDTSYIESGTINIKNLNSRNKASYINFYSEKIIGLTNQLESVLNEEDEDKAQKIKQKIDELLKIPLNKKLYKTELFNGIEKKIMEIISGIKKSKNKDKYEELMKIKKELLTLLRHSTGMN